MPKVISKQVVKDSASAQKALQNLINSAQSITDHFRSTYSSALQSQLPSKSKSDSLAKSNTSKSTVSSSRTPHVIDRSSNIVLFGLKEVKLLIAFSNTSLVVQLILIMLTVLVAVTQQMFLTLYLLHLHLDLF